LEEAFDKERKSKRKMQRRFNGTMSRLQRRFSGQREEITPSLMKEQTKMKKTRGLQVGVLCPYVSGGAKTTCITIIDTIIHHILTNYTYLIRRLLF
jgi:hypothetical protein